MSSIEYLSLDQNGIVVLDYEDLIKEKNLSVKFYNIYYKIKRILLKKLLVFMV